MLISLTVSILLFFVKFAAYLITGSAAIFSDALESIVNIAATSLGLMSIFYSLKPPDKDHPYGHGNIEYFSAGVEGFMILIAAGGIITYAILDIIKGPQIQDLDIGLLIISFAGVVNLLLGLFLIRTGKKTKSLAIEADGKHILSDSYTSFGVVIGVALVFIFDIKILDPVCAILVALNILYTGYKLLRQSFGGLMNEVDPEITVLLCAKLIKIKNPAWIDIHELRYRQSGSKFFVDFHLIYPYYRSIKESHKEEIRIKNELQKEFDNFDLKIHFDHCNSGLCKFCSVQDCPVRNEPLSINIDWTPEKMIGDPVYRSFHTDNE